MRQVIKPAEARRSLDWCLSHQLHFGMGTAGLDGLNYGDRFLGASKHFLRRSREDRMGSFPPSAPQPFTGREPRSVPGALESRATGEHGEAPRPLRGVMFVVCCKCGEELPPVAVAHGDPADGLISHGYCPVHARDLREEVERLLACWGWMLMLMPWALLAGVGR